LLARDVIYTSRAYAVMPVHLSVTEVHWRIIANLGFKFQSHFTAHCGRRAAGRRRAAYGRIISRLLDSDRLSCVGCIASIDAIDYSVIDILVYKMHCITLLIVFHQRKLYLFMY